TPHTISLQLSNARTATLQGSSFGDGQVRYGFEFTIPFTVSRYFGKRRSRSTGDVGGNVAAEVAMNDQLRFTSETVRIRTGQAVRWTNTSSLIHTVTADPSKANNASSVELPSGARPFDSGDLQPGDAFTHRFTEPGTYRYFCMPHEGAGMVATVIVSG
ncbi:MAG: plastocyanin/azurin family copper-binding protein, partial [Longimicrobiales bacterium]